MISMTRWSEGTYNQLVFSDATAELSRSNTVLFVGFDLKRVFNKRIYIIDLFLQNKTKNKKLKHRPIFSP
jgi:hypothetical protein